jgi:hypothetical protein
MTDYEKFQTCIINAAQKILLPAIEECKDELGEAVWNDLFDIGEKRKVDRKLGHDEIFFGKIFCGFIEIDSSFRTLRDIEVYVGSFPYRSATITRSRHLRYHIENYFNEIYLFKERLKKYLTTIGRCYRKDSRHHEILSRTRLIFRLIDQVLEGIIATRGHHVHVSRFEHSELSRLEQLELLVSAGPEGISEALDNYYRKFVYRQIRRKWKNQIRENNDALQKLLDVYSKVVVDILFDNESSEIIYPSSITST